MVDAPVLAAGQSDVAYSWMGQTRNISCHVLAEPSPDFEWRHNKEVLSNNEVYEIFNTTTSSSLQASQLISCFLVCFDFNK